MTHENTSSDFTLWDDLKKRIGISLHHKRMQKGYKLKAVAQDTNISIGTLSAIENGRGNLNMEKVRSLARYYGISPDDFFHATAQANGQAQPAI